jgi:hypothetical protein
MALQLVEFLTTLLTKGSLRSTIQSGLVPLITTIISYMILPTSQFQQLNKSEFSGEKDVFEHSVRNYCLELIKQLIEAYDDYAIESIIFVCEKFLKGEYTPSTTLQ